MLSPYSVVNGLSPRVRGNLSVFHQILLLSGSIPACAGEPRGAQRTAPPLTVYPRVCGGTARPSKMSRRRPGLSPRVRGNRGGCAAVEVADGSIPACAGEPPPAHTSPHGSTVYPRVCGGTSCSSPLRPLSLGLSPRVRGNPFLPCSTFLSRGSIPACAGEPRTQYPPRRSVEVYPRVCGGTRQ